MKQWRTFEAVCALFLLCACHRGLDHTQRAVVPIRIGCSPDGVKSAVVNPDLVSNLNLFIIGEGGIAEEHCYWDFSRKDCPAPEVVLLKGRTFKVFAFANAGFDLGSLDLSELESLRWFLGHPDGYDHGLPMSCRIEEFKVGENTAIDLELVRMVSRISVTLDRSRLQSGIDFFIREARIGNCARSARVFGESAALDGNDVFAAGYHTMCNDEFDLYTLENCQSGPQEGPCSYVEMEIDYLSDSYHSTGSGLVYRFHILDEGRKAVRRNCHYRITVRPNADGLLCEDSWRVDKKNLVSDGAEPYLRLSPPGTVVDGVFYGNYYLISPGDSLHLAFSRNPRTMKVSLDSDMVEEERSEGRAAYTMDRDGNGFGVKSLGRICQSAMNICVQEPYSHLDDMVIIEVADRASGQ